MKNLVDLSDKQIIVMGASQGIGRETSILLSELGAKCVLVARSQSKLEETLSLLEGDGHVVCACDLNDLEQIDSLAKKVHEDLGPIDGLVYCVGISDDCPFHLQKPEKVHSVLHINLGGYLESVRVFTKKKRFNPGMRIVGVSSSAAFKGSLAHTSYSASKAGMDGAVRCLAKELAPKGISINNVAPGMIRTAMYENYLKGCGGEDSPAVKKLESRQYLGIGEPADVAAVIAFLLSPAARFITGITLPVDGGSTTN